MPAQTRALMRGGLTALSPDHCGLIKKTTFFSKTAKDLLKVQHHKMKWWLLAHMKNAHLCDRPPIKMVNGGAFTKMLD